MIALYYYWTARKHTAAEQHVVVVLVMQGTREGRNIDVGSGLALAYLRYV